MTSIRARTPRRSVGADPGLHKVGLVAALVGSGALWFLPFGVFRPTRIHDGVSWSAATALEPMWLAALAGLWIALLVLSLRFARGARGSLLCGMVADALIVAMLLGNAITASAIKVTFGSFSRFSFGASVWVGLVACFMVLLSCNRELERWPVARWGVLLGAPVVVALLTAAGCFADTGIMREYANYSERFWIEAGNHIAMSAAAVAIGTVIGIALGVIAFSYRRAERTVFTVVNVLQTIPSLAAIVLMLPLLAGLATAFPWLRAMGVGGTGWAPVVIVLTAYALLAISVNTHAGLRAVPPAVIDAGNGMGMTEGQLLRRVRLPLAAPVVMSGVRTAAVQTVGSATLAAFIGAGGLGVFIFQGMAQVSPDLILLGSLTLVLLAVSTDAILRGVETLVTPRGRRTSRDGGQT